MKTKLTILILVGLVALWYACSRLHEGFQQGDTLFNFFHHQLGDCNAYRFNVATFPWTRYQIELDLSPGEKVTKIDHESCETKQLDPYILKIRYSCFLHTNSGRQIPTVVVAEENVQTHESQLSVNGHVLGRFALPS